MKIIVSSQEEKVQVAGFIQKAISSVKLDMSREDIENMATETMLCNLRDCISVDSGLAEWFAWILVAIVNVNLTKEKTPQSVLPVKIDLTLLAIDTGQWETA